MRVTGLVVYMRTVFLKSAINLNVGVYLCRGTISPIFGFQFRYHQTLLRCLYTLYTVHVYNAFTRVFVWICWIDVNGCLSAYSNLNLAHIVTVMQALTKINIKLCHQQAVFQCTFVTFMSAKYRRTVCSSLWIFKCPLSSPPSLFVKESFCIHFW